MDILWNYMAERWNIPIKMESFIFEDLAEEDLLKIDVAFELFRDAEEQLIKSQDNLEEHEKDPAWAHIEGNKITLKKAINSHIFVIYLFHTVEKVLKSRLTVLDENLKFEQISFAEIIYRISTYRKGFDVTKFENYNEIKLLQEVANCAKHGLEVDKSLAKKHSTFIFRQELPYLGEFIHDYNLVPSCWSFICEVYECVER